MDNTGLVLEYLTDFQSWYLAYGSVGPVVDGTYVPELPGQLLLKGAYHKEVKVMVGHNSNEVTIYTFNFD